LCELSYEPLPEIDEDEDGYDDDDEEDEREENPLKKLVNVDVSWLQNGLGFDRESKTMVPLEGDTMYGEFPIKGRNGEMFMAEIYGGEGDGWGPVFHEDCIACVSAQLKRAVTYEDGIEIFNIVGDGSRARYGDQHFEWRRAVEEEGPAYFYSPMSPKGGETRDRVLEKIAGWISKQKRIASPTGKRRVQREEAVVELERVRAELNRALAKVEDIRRDVAAREAAVAALSSPVAAAAAAAAPAVAAAASPVKKGRQTKKRSPKKQPPKKAAAAAVSAAAAATSSAALNCPSHKTKETCPPGACVWGKTNRCSKKRN
jgi:hypothetical protein